MRLIFKDGMLGFTKGRVYKALHDKVNKMFYIKSDVGCVIAISESYIEYHFEKCKPSSLEEKHV